MLHQVPGREGGAAVAGPPALEAHPDGQGRGGLARPRAAALRDGAGVPPAARRSASLRQILGERFGVRALAHSVPRSAWPGGVLQRPAVCPSAHEALGGRGGIPLSVGSANVAVHAQADAVAGAGHMAERRADLAAQPRSSWRSSARGFARRPQPSDHVVCAMGRGPRSECGVAIVAALFTARDVGEVASQGIAAVVSAPEAIGQCGAAASGFLAC